MQRPGMSVSQTGASASHELRSEVCWPVKTSQEPCKMGRAYTSDEGTALMAATLKYRRQLQVRIHQSGYHDCISKVTIWVLSMLQITVIFSQAGRLLTSKYIRHGPLAELLTSDLRRRHCKEALRIL